MKVKLKVASKEVSFSKLREEVFGLGNKRNQSKPTKLLKKKSLWRGSTSIEVSLLKTR